MSDELKLQTQYIKNLPGKIKESITMYTGGMFDVFNETLRNNLKFQTEEDDRMFRDITFAFENVPLTNRAITVYRGVGKDRGSFSDTAFVSTTLSEEFAEHFTGHDCCFLQITVSPGSKILPIMQISQMSDEQEVLLDRNGYFLKTGEGKHGKLRKIFLTYTTNKPIIIDAKASDKLLLQELEDEFSD